MNNLMKEMKRSLRELDLGLKGELTISSDMEDLSNSLFFDQVKINLVSINVIFAICILGSSNLDQACLCLNAWFISLVC